MVVSETAKAIFALLESKEVQGLCPTTGKGLYKMHGSSNNPECVFMGYRYMWCGNEVRITKPGSPELICTLAKKNGNIEVGFEAPYNGKANG